MSSTTYEINVAGETVETRTRKESAIAFAANLLDESPGSVVTVTTEAGTEVFSSGTLQAEPEPEAPVTGRAKPFTRIETKASFEVPELEGYTAAYVRNRTKTVVYRANDKSGWLVVDTRDGKQTAVDNTTEARKRTNELEAALKAEVKAAKEREATEKAEARAKKVEDREARKAAEAQAKADRKAAKEAAAA